MVKCRHPLCEQSFKRSQLLKHESLCELALIQCKNSGNCQKICRKDLEKHYAEGCEYRPIECSSQCGKILPLCDLDSHLQYDCINTEVHCPQSCELILQRKNIELHILHTCPLSVVACMFFSYDGDYCGHKCFRNELEEHQLTCNLRKVRCKNIGCHQRIVYKCINEHDDVCKFKKIECRNKCGEEILRGNSEEHFKVCEYEKVLCSYSVVGCEQFIMRKNMHEHLENSALEHSALMINGIKESSFRIEKLNFDIQCTKEIVQQEIIKVKNAIVFNIDDLAYYLGDNNHFIV